MDKTQGIINWLAKDEIEGFKEFGEKAFDELDEFKQTMTTEINEFKTEWEGIRKK
jgi:hypothetical protein